VSARLAKGRRAESAVADYLRARGFAILAHNVRLGALEIDLVARSTSLVAIVEVRVRGEGSLEGPLASITREKRARVLRAAQRLWTTRIASMPGVERYRIDVAAVYFEGARTFVEYVPGAIVSDWS
jgi:putative endonuclease